MNQANTEKHIENDSISAEVGDAARNVVVGKDIIQIDNSTTIGKRATYIFRDLKQIVAVLFTIVSIGLGTTYWYFQSISPPVMNGEFNIAVATFNYSGNQTDKEYGKVVSNWLVSFLDTEYQTKNLGFVEIANENIGIINDSIVAQEIVEKTNADIVIHGSVVTIENAIVITPQFYVNDNLFRANLGEINGQHQFTNSITLSAADLAQWDSNANKSLRAKVGIVNDFLIGIAYLFSAQYIQAQASFEDVIQHAEDSQSFEGVELIYLFASRVALLQNEIDAAQNYVNKALEINSRYGRAYIAQANIYYVQKLHDQAFVSYVRASQLENQPREAFILEKSNLGIGNIHLDGYIYSDNNTVKELLKEEAQKRYESVINSYEIQAGASQNLAELAATAHVNLGRLYQVEGNIQQAILAFKSCINLTKDERLLVVANERLNQLQQ